MLAQLSSTVRTHAMLPWICLSIFIRERLNFLLLLLPLPFSSTFSFSFSFFWYNCTRASISWHFVSVYSLACKRVLTCMSVVMETIPPFYYMRACPILDLYLVVTRKRALGLPFLVHPELRASKLNKCDRGSHHSTRTSQQQLKIGSPAAPLRLATPPLKDMVLTCPPLSLYAAGPLSFCLTMPPVLATIYTCLCAEGGKG